MLNSVKTQGTAMKKRDYPQQELGKLFSDALDHKKISRAEAARRLRVTRAAITDMCKTGRMKKRRLMEIARLTDTPVEHFLAALRTLLLAVAVGVIAAPDRAEASVLPNAGYTHMTFAKSLKVLYIIRTLWRFLVRDFLMDRRVFAW